MPDRFNAGETILYRRSYADFPIADGWAATLYLSGAANHTEPAATVGTQFEFELTAAQTGGFPAGVYQWQERVSKGSETYTVDEGTVTIDPNIATAPAGSLIPFAEKLLPQVEAAIEALVTGKVQEYQVAGRAVRYNDLEFLTKLRNQLANAVKAKQHAGTFGPTVQAHFRQPS